MLHVSEVCLFNIRLSTRFSSLCKVHLIEEQSVYYKGHLYPCFVLDKLFVGTQHRNGGLGTDILKRITEFADLNNYIILLTDSDSYGSEPKRLRKFYWTHGFRIAKAFGINTQHTLCRLPQKRAA